MLSGVEIDKQYRKGSIYIDPYNFGNIGPNSYDLTLSDQMLILDSIPDGDISKPHYIKVTALDGVHTLYPGAFYLLASKEVVATDSYVPMIEGRSSLGRLGVTVHNSCGMGDVGYYGSFTFPVTTHFPVTIPVGTRFAHLYFEEIQGNVPMDSLYRVRKSSHYNRPIKPGEPIGCRGFLK